MKGIRRNERGTVLLTVLCFTTMCMVIAAIALNVSNHSNKQSTNNVMKEQAQITAEHYLEQYLSTFPDAIGTNNQTRKNYDDLKALAGTDEKNATKITIKVEPSVGATSNVNISDGTLNDTAVYGGNCAIYIYKSGSGIVVKSEAKYDEQTGVSSAYFYGESPATNLNKNAIETCGTYNVQDTACVAGDILLTLGNDKSMVTYFQNNNGQYNANFKTEGNLRNNTQDVRFRDTIDLGNGKQAPTITAEGIMFFTQLDIKTTVGKTDNQGRHIGDTGYDLKNLYNKNGYINCAKRIVFTGNTGNSIGESGKPIDVYCAAMTIGLIPDGSESVLGTEKAKLYGSERTDGSYRTDIENLFNYYTDNEGNKQASPAGSISSSNQGSGIKQMYGNIYVYKDPTKTDPDVNGDLTVNIQNQCTINGDLVVDGNIYLISGSDKLKVTGKVICTGEVYGGTITTLDENGNEIKLSSFPKQLPTDQRHIQPAMDYSPALYKFGELDNPTITSPQNYLHQDPTNMYVENSDRTKHFKDNFMEAIKYTLADKYPDGTKVCPQYDDSQNWSDPILGYKEIAKCSAINNISDAAVIQHSCRLTPTDLASVETIKNAFRDAGGDQNQMTQKSEGLDFYVDVQDSDIWILLPAIANGNVTQKARFRVNNANNKHHCYFVYYLYDAAKDYTTTAGQEDGAKLYSQYIQQTDDAGNTVITPKISSIKKTTYTLLTNQNNIFQVATKQFADSFDTQSPTNDTAKTNIIYLLPANMTINIGSGSMTCNEHAVFYGPYSILNASLNNGNKIYGQVKVDTYNTNGAANKDESAKFCDLEDNSILHTYLTKAASTGGSLNFQYYIKHD